MDTGGGEEVTKGKGLSEPEGFEEATTYAVASTVLLIVLVSLLAERCINRLKKYLKRKNQKPMRKVVDKMTQELMLLGFISLLLTVLQTSVSKICVRSDSKFSKRMLPCSVKDYEPEDLASSPSAIFDSAHGRRRLLEAYKPGVVAALHSLPRRFLVSDDDDNSNKCGKGKTPFVSRESLHELHIFIFVLAATHVFYSGTTMLLAFVRLHRWKSWEKDTQKEGYDPKQDLEKRYREEFAAKKPGSQKWTSAESSSPVKLWTSSFFRQFMASVSREDYLAFRLQFIKNHNLAPTFNFWDYVIRSMEVEFKQIIGISWWLWIFVTVFLLMNIHGWYTYFWMAFIPGMILLVLGTKQQHVIALLGLRTKQNAAEYVNASKSGPEGFQRSPEGSQRSRSKNGTQIRPTAAAMAAAAAAPAAAANRSMDKQKVLWFDNPKLLSRVLHFVIFQNSFELAYFLWLVTSFGWNSCVLGNHALLIVRVVIGVLTQAVSSFSTLPIFALVTQMGSQMKHTIFRKDVHEGLQAWRAKVQTRKLKMGAGQGAEGATQPNGQTPSSSAVAPANGEAEQITPAAAEEGATLERQSSNPFLTNRLQQMYGKTKTLEKIRSGELGEAARQLSGHLDHQL